MPKLKSANVAMGAQTEDGESKMGGMEGSKGYLVKVTVKVEWIVNCRRDLASARGQGMAQPSRQMEPRQARDSSMCVEQEVGPWYNIAECTALGQKEERWDWRYKQGSDHAIVGSLSLSPGDGSYWSVSSREVLSSLCHLLGHTVQCSPYNSLEMKAWDSV